MSAIGKTIGKLLGVKTPKPPTPAPDAEKPKAIPTEDDPDVRRTVLEAELEARNRRGRSYTRTPGRAMGGQRTTLG